MEITPGTKAPDFALRNQHGETVRLSDFRAGAGDTAGNAGNPGNPGKNVVLLFFPFAFTGICTGELCEVRDRLPAFVNKDTQLLAISNDSPFALRIFADQEGLEYPLLSDFWPHGEVSRAYGVFNEERGCALRGTFIIDREGVVRWSVINGMPDARDLDAYIAALDALREEV
ncbi:redoxin domain-containing protein [Streptomyces alkaliphilus]|uniref:Alkyl hydroperoxide reductase E n=1 Tax=Streptomyces alkaliphilus TaxID=1472722 RepID=A0A7W3TBN0_9ACTN|nr:peroxiredoxin [Streptomyces alkaliphilus]MBB0243787.1 redoxin domain-containing protein [Streptomyces alkaliphilus]